MATDMPRKNVYIKKDTAELLEAHASKHSVSESEVVRRALDLYLCLVEFQDYKAAMNFAKDKDVGVDAVILATLSRQVPMKYYESN